MNRSPSLPDRIISIPWLVFEYEGVSLSQMIYTSSASRKVCDEENAAVSPASRERIAEWFWRGENEKQTPKIHTHPETEMMSLSNLQSSSDATASIRFDQSARSVDSEGAGGSSRMGESEAEKAGEGMMVRPSVRIAKGSDKQEFWKEMRENDELYKVVLYKICLVVRKIHKMGVIHRDIKPENVLISHLRLVQNKIDYDALTVNLVSLLPSLRAQIDFGSSILPEVPALYPIPASMDQCTKLYAPPEASTNQFTQVCGCNCFDCVELRYLESWRNDARNDLWPQRILSVRAATIRKAEIIPCRDEGGDRR